MEEEKPQKPRGAPGQPFIKGDARAGRPKGTVNAATKEVREMARSLVENPVYRKNLQSRLNAGECSPPVETMLWHYAYGKPKELIELTSDDKPIAIIINGAMPIPHEVAQAIDVEASVNGETTTTLERTQS